ncbi:hypothetical protein JAAARDRAFT_35672 [Jaapia argillacea MUCL 33604]|uniref:Uncharacterized protein n=1 Tax=Jaapia argillacea MUCL 33604 TaxID=933084 RepID=A0A067Q0R3_9AGAM|nr:hypothetical protein JAAARDRAFT_35672 [Jaapia argillacea MUCL 33604]
MVALPSPSPTMMVTERTRPWPSPPTLHPGRSIPPDAVKAPGLHVKLANCPIISAESPTNRPISHLTRNQRRRRQKRVSTQTRTEKLRPMFWRPSLGMGVKSRGYAMGFEGSYVRLDEREVMEGRYVRDTMRKAVLVNWQAR